MVSSTCSIPHYDDAWVGVPSKPNFELLIKNILKLSKVVRYVVSKNAAV